MIMFLNSSALWLLDIAAFILRTQAVLTKDLDIPLEDRINNGNDLIFTFNWVQDILFSFEVCNVFTQLSCYEV